jgi:hypothetical protein
MGTQLLALRGMFDHLVRLIIAEDTAAILSMLLESGVEPNGYVGLEASAYEDDETFLRWILGQWLEAIQQQPPWLNTMRNVTLSYGEKRGWVDPYNGEVA